MTNNAAVLNPSMPYATCANAAVRRASRRLGQIYDDAFIPCGLKATQYSLLSQIFRSQRPTMRDLAKDLVMDLSALGHTLKPLVRDGFVELTVDERDRRARRVNLTDVGLRKYEEARKISKRVCDIFDDIYGFEEAVRLRESLAFIASEQFAEDVAKRLNPDD
ncbi:MAG: Transcriptional regulator, MarR family [Pseudomonas sp.]|nr:Transcriptional regulator, MarR family [Pseudomonas sp.]